MEFFHKPHPRTPKSWSFPYAQQGMRLRFLQKNPKEGSLPSQILKEDKDHSTPAAHAHGLKTMPRGAPWFLRAELLGKLWAALRPFPWKPGRWSETKPPVGQK